MVFIHLAEGNIANATFTAFDSGITKMYDSKALGQGFIKYLLSINLPVTQHALIKCLMHIKHYGSGV